MSQESGSTVTPVKVVYDDAIVRKFAFMTVIWGIVGMLVGVIVALQLAFHPANVHAMLSFGRLRPLHTNAVIFAFVGNMMFAGVYHSSQRLLKARMASDLLSKIHFWGWQAIIVAAAITLPLGITQGKEYAELEWPIDIAIALVWVAFAVNFFWTLAKRNERQLYVAIWFYIASIITVAVLHIVNSLALPVGPLKSYSIFGGAQDALVQWWYGHNAVAFFLTTPILGIMYYYLPKAANKPVYSYRLSIIHFWALIFMYIWAGPHHLLNTALPEWAQSLGMIFSIMLWAPSWGGMVNGLLTLRGGWQQVRTDPVLKFFAAGVSFYGMATFEGPLLSIKSVSGLAHYTDWIIGHVHSGALGWNGFMAAGMLYWMIPRLYGKDLWSKKLAEAHFWLGTMGILLYVIAMWVSGVTQGLMWRAQNPDGSLTYIRFVETVIAIRPMYWMRLIGGSMYFVGFLMMAWNLLKTAMSGKPVTTEVEIMVETKTPVLRPWKEVVFGKPVVLAVVVFAFFSLFLVTNLIASPFFAIVGFVVALFGTIAFYSSERQGGGWHRLVEGRALLMAVMATIAVLIGGVAELVPAIVTKPAEIRSATDVKPYRPLELEGRDVYLREGCYTCHSQMIRPTLAETKRYDVTGATGPSSLADSMYDHPFQWGSKRTGPDLAHEGGKNSNLWHHDHLVNPRAITVGSNMPGYAHLSNERIEFSGIANKMHAMKAIGVPYTDADIASAERDASSQAATIVQDLRESSQGRTTVAADSRMVALIAYLQRLGSHAPPPSKPLPVAVQEK